jgi:hypothetical protein
VGAPDAENAKRVLKALRGSLRPTDLPTYRRSLKIQGSETIITACLQRMSFTMP